MGYCHGIGIHLHKKVLCGVARVGSLKLNRFGHVTPPFVGRLYGIFYKVLLEPNHRHVVALLKNVLRKAISLFIHIGLIWFYRMKIASTDEF